MYTKTGCDFIIVYLSTQLIQQACFVKLTYLANTDFLRVSTIVKMLLTCPEKIAVFSSPKNIRPAHTNQSVAFWEYFRRTSRSNGSCRFWRSRATDNSIKRSTQCRRYGDLEPRSSRNYMRPRARIERVFLSRYKIAPREGAADAVN